MSCEGCIQSVRQKNEAEEKIRAKAQELANKTGHWYGLWFDATGTAQYIRADLINGEPVTTYFSPKV